MPGHIGTSIAANTLRSQDIKQPKDMSEGELEVLRAWMRRRRIPDEGLTDEQVRGVVQAQIDSFHDTAPLSAARAAEQILDAVKAKRWRLLVGEDAKYLDRMARENPEQLYEPEFLARLREQIPRKS